MFFHIFEALRTLGNKALIDQILFDNDMHDGIEHWHVTAWLKGQMMRSFTRKFSSTWIQQNQFGAGTQRIFHPRRTDRMIHCRICTDQYNYICFIDVCNRVGYGT